MFARVRAGRRQPARSRCGRRRCSSARMRRWRLSRSLGVVALSGQLQPQSRTSRDCGRRWQRSTEVPPVAAARVARRAAPAARRDPRGRRVGRPLSRRRRRCRMRWGLYQGASLGNAARDAYVRELDGALLPRWPARIEARLIEYAPEPEKLYDYLKAYLMLGDPERLDKEQLAAARRSGMAGRRHRRRRPPALVAAFPEPARAGRQLRPCRSMTTLVAQARSTHPAGVDRRGLDLQRHPAARTSADTARALRLDVAAGLGAERVLRRKSGVRLRSRAEALHARRCSRRSPAKATGELVEAVRRRTTGCGAREGAPDRATGQSCGREVTRPLRAGLHRGPGTQFSTDIELVPIAIARADQRGARDPRGADLAAARLPEGGGRQHLL